MKNTNKDLNLAQKRKKVIKTSGFPCYNRIFKEQPIITGGNPNG